MKAIQIEKLKKVYPVVKGYRELLFHPFRRKGITALRGIDLEVEPSQCFCLMGPNGAGKTTLIKILSTLVLPDEGNVIINGHDLKINTDEVKKHIGFALSEERSFYWRLTGLQNLDFFAALNGIPLSHRREKIQEVLNLVGLENAAERRFNTYSTGMRQMMAIARALLTDPDILFVDEPTRSLDPVAAQNIRNFLRKDMVENHKKTVFWATHDLSEAQEFAHTIAVIAQGQIRDKGSVSDLTEQGKISLQKVYKKAVEES
ncbi:MAG: ATP-binding cassette domain-containing protein [Candidatus Aminicenantes bacterium]|nr:ATP-binding cassette domain-containing protein [Candidatus Aminicenantes bacterium]